MHRRVLFVDESEDEGDYVEAETIRNNVEEEPEEGQEEEEEEVQPVEVDLDDEIEEVAEENKDLEEEEDNDLEEKEDDLEEEEEEDNDLEEEEEEEDLEEEEEGSYNPYYFGKKSPTLRSDFDEIKNPSYSNPNENQRSPPMDKHTTKIKPKPKMLTAKPTIPSKRASENRKNVEVTRRSKIRKVLDGSHKKEDRFGKKESGKKFSGTCRLWSEDDEITILKGMIDYHSEKGIDPYADMRAFHKFIIKLLHIDVSKDQLIRKIRRLKKKYQDNMEKMENGNKDIVFPRPHEQKSFKLSKKIWGAEDDDDDNDDVDDHEVLEKGEASKAKDKAGQEKFCWSLYPCLNESLHLEQFSKYSLPDSGMSFVKERLGSVGSAKAKEFEDKWRQLHVAETEVKMKQAQLIVEQTKMILNAIK